MSALHPHNETLGKRERLVLNLYTITTLAVLVLMMLFGLIMRMAQGTWLNIPPDIFYQLMTAHGAGMVGAAGLGSCAVMWFFLRKYVPLGVGMFAANYVLFVLGAVLILGSTFIGHYGGAWTFLYPLPVHSMGVWSVNAAAVFMLGYVLIGVGFLLFYLDAMWAMIRVYGNLGRALGLQWLFGGTIDKSHPVTVVASTMVSIVNTLGVLGGAVVLVMSLVNAYVPGFAPDALLVKNLIYFFGHVFINASIYMAVIAVYELLPRYTGRAWYLSRPVVWAWVASTVLVLSVYPHHLLMDFVMPRWASGIAQALSFASGLPVFTVTAYGALMNVFRSGLRWTMPSRLIVLSMFGWAAGVVPAIVDATISANRVMHNTTWVPGHFHFYLLLGVVPMLLAFMYYLIDQGADKPEPAGDRHGFAAYYVGGVIFVMMFLAGGHASEPRRFAVHVDQWIPYDRVAAIGAVLVIAAMLVFALRIGAGLLRTPGRTPTPVAPNGRTPHGAG
jgi:cytochrome c oxidase subunit 1